MDEAQQEPSTLLKWFGSVTPRNRPEDFKQIREEFELAVAKEVISEVESSENRSHNDQHPSR